LGTAAHVVREKPRKTRNRISGYFFMVTLQRVDDFVADILRKLVRKQYKL
jgi:hypothetical protein